MHCGLINYANGDDKLVVHVWCRSIGRCVFCVLARLLWFFVSLQSNENGEVSAKRFFETICWMKVGLMRAAGMRRRRRRKRRILTVESNEAFTCWESTDSDQRHPIRLRHSGETECLAESSRLFAFTSASTMNRQSICCVHLDTKRKSSQTNRKNTEEF